MRYLFIVQGDGRGHMTQAITLSEMLQRNGHKVVAVLIGKSKEREIPEFFLKKVNAYVETFETPSLIFKKNKKHIHPIKTILYNINPKRIKKYGKSIEKIHERIKSLEPDVIVNFYEVLTGFTYLRYNLKMPIITIGHQYLMKHRDYKFADIDDKNILAFKLHTLLCNIGATKTLGLSFYKMKDDIANRIAVVPPLIRKEVIKTESFFGEYTLVYMVNAGYEKEIRKWHEENLKVTLHVFWDKKGTPKKLKIDETLTFHTIDDVKFLKYMAGCDGYITTAGFESVCEAMYLNKPIMMIPAHMEQEINAADAASVGAGIIGDNFNISILLDSIDKRDFDNASFKQWGDSAEEIFLRHLTTFV